MLRSDVQDSLFAITFFSHTSWNVDWAGLQYKGVLIMDTCYNYERTRVCTCEPASVLRPHTAQSLGYPEKRREGERGGELLLRLVHSPPPQP